MRNMNSNAAIMAAIAKGWKPNRYLSNMSMAFFNNNADYVATKIFPICPVQNSTGFYYEFLKGDLARDNVQRKPAFGKVALAAEHEVALDEEVDALANDHRNHRGCL